MHSRTVVVAAISTLLLVAAVALLSVIALTRDAAQAPRQPPPAGMRRGADAPLAAHADEAPQPRSRSSDPGDLVFVYSNGSAVVGFLLDEFPTQYAVQSRIQNDTLNRDDKWWTNRVLEQLSLTSYELTFLSSYYSKLQQLTLPFDNAAYTVTFLGPAAVETIDGHLHVVRQYNFSTYVVASPGSVAISDKQLGKVGGTRNISFNLPVDPFLVGQRSGWACFDEDQFPHNSIDTESTAVYYDDSCTPGNSWPITQQCLLGVTGCHCSVNVTLSCDKALKKSIGRSQLTIVFERVAWDESIAKHYESLNSYQPIAGAVGSDLKGYTEGFEHQIVIYRYYGANSCEASECLTEYGFRKLVLFDAIHINLGNDSLNIGALNYTAANASSFDYDEKLFHYEYYFAACHRHPHFSNYAGYQIGASLGHKQGFCIQSTQRVVNARTTPMWSEYQNCSLQGVTNGWADSYNLGISCQFVDITDQSTSSGAVSESLQVFGNPLHWLCEGEPVLDNKGNLEWVATGQKTTKPPYDIAGKSIDIVKCATSPSAWNNNNDSVSFTNPTAGNGMITASCPAPPKKQIYGPNRDCEFNAGSMMNSCTPGATVSLQCTVPSSKPQYPQVLRVCESSIALQTGTACRIMDSPSFTMFNSTLANVIIIPNQLNTVTFTCPTYRDSVEVGGYYSLYYGAVYNGVDPDVNVKCVVSN